jgi:hypothetical protein
MAQIKQTVELLTKILKSNGFSKIKPECFRLAKFDKTEAVCKIIALLVEHFVFLSWA